MKKRVLWALIGLALAALGLGCLNYVKPSTLEYHQEWATAHDAPPPGKVIAYAGVGSFGLGAVLLGYVVGASRRKG